MYSRRSAAREPLSFFIKIPFGPGGRPVADDANDIALVGVAHDEQASAVRNPESQPPRFADGVVGIGAGHGKIVGKDRTRVFERDAVLALTCGGLPLVLFEARTTCSYA